MMNVSGTPATLGADSVLEPLQAKMFSGLLELRAAGFGERPEADCMDGLERLLGLADKITRFVLASRTGGIRTVMNVDDIMPMAEPAECRMGDNALKKHRYSIETFGLRNPLVVRSVAAGVELVCGYIRHRACTELKLHKVPVVIKTLDDMEALELALLDILLGNGWNYAEPDYLWALLRFYGELNER
ncbi:ParB/RepB/Spo0J family partition protein [Verrucomicrobiota bacterium]